MSPSSPHAPRPRRLRLSLAAVAAGMAAVTLAACGGGSSDDAAPEASSSATGSAFEPVTITHAFGETTIDKQPKRVASWGWASNDAAIALGVVPVAMPAQSYGGDKEGVLPWNREAIEKAGAEMPTILSESEEPPYEEFIAAKPDVILAHYSGITEEQYKKLAAIAPTVAYPEEAWATPWRDVITTTGEVLGKEKEAEAAIANVEKSVSDAAAAHPEFAGKTIAAVRDFQAFYVYTPADPRVEFLADLGFEIAPSVEELDTGESTFFFTLSYEQTDKLTSDVLVSYFDTQKEADTFAKAKSTTVMEQAKAGTIAPIVGTELVAAVSPPTALSLTWGLDDFTTVLSEAATAADAS